LFDAQVVIFSSLYLTHVSTNWVSLHTYYVALTLLSFLISLCLPESPKFLVSRKEYAKASEAYNTIAKINLKPVLFRDQVRFKEERVADKKALKRHFRVA